ncbi:Rehydrin [Halomicronema hongdechloris C2206]|uniref:thioredoxin-dependent peroxiredoxin n=1 Tax=Halomicronema hongdechloris C2206 TaxID=1641165 RepID=A0A1Z3HGH5_9CYAN|nr:peroxiredoxin [Halomicronema hongdechloris]ASC69429.1 Rehydrin [Halomicronema hongdechloris C2206]
MGLCRRTWLRWCFAVGLVVLSWLATTPSTLAMGGPQIPLGQMAPDFTLPTNADDGAISLSDYRGQWVVLYFYPQDFTSGCTLEAQRFQRDLDDYRRHNAQILGVSADDVASHDQFCDAEGLAFPLLSDPNGTVSQLYGAWLGFRSLRHTYVIDPEGVMRARFLGVRPAIHSQEVLAKLERLQIQAN